MFKEMERIRTQIQKSRETTPSILQPMILDFDSVGSQRSLQDTTTSTPNASLTWGAITNNRTYVM